jgi:Protein of unknown function (DUF1549)/Protein of unknown function (DUF1553)
MNRINVIGIFMLIVEIAASSSGQLVFAAEELLPADRLIPEVIDHYVELKLKQAGITPAPQADDSTFLRRLTLDLAGRIPTSAEAKAYVESKDPDKRAKLLERLMASPEYVRHAATEFDTLLRANNDQAQSLRPYLLVALKENRPWDRMFRELMGVEPDPNRPDQFVLSRLGDLDRLTRDVSGTFFGVNIMCAQCHKHPYVSSITQDYYYGMKAFFSRSINFQGQLWEKRYAEVEYKAQNGQIRPLKLMFLSGKVLDEPKGSITDVRGAIQEENQRLNQFRNDFAKNKQYPPKPAFNYREQLVAVALQPSERDLFARSIINRLWYRFHGYGLVMRLDQMHMKNRPNHSELLQWLTRDFVTHNYDIRRLVRGLVESRTYSLASRWEGKETPPPKLFAVAISRPLTPMQFGVSQLLVSRPDALPESLSPDSHNQRLEKLETEARDLFGSVIEQPQDDMQINVTEALRLSNDPRLLKSLGDGLVSQLTAIRDRGKQIEAAVWAVLSRPPNDDEKRLLTDYLTRCDREGDAKQSGSTQARKALQQMVWALLNSGEFRFNH